MTTMPAGEKSFRLTIAKDGEDTASAMIAASLGADVAQEFGPRNEMPLSILAHATDGSLAGGLNGASHWRWLYVRNFWIDARFRRQGLGRALLDEATTQARLHGCVGLYLDTFSPQAEMFYRTCGFAVCGRIGNFPPGATRVFLQKPLG